MPRLSRILRRDSELNGFVAMRRVVVTHPRCRRPGFKQYLLNWLFRHNITSSKINVLIKCC